MVTADERRPLIVDVYAGAYVGFVQRFLLWRTYPALIFLTTEDLSNRLGIVNVFPPALLSVEPSLELLHDDQVRQAYLGL